MPLSTVLANSRGQLAEKPGERSTPTCLPGTCLPALPAHHAWVQRTRLAQAGTVGASPCCSASSAVSGSNRCRHAYGLAKVQQRHPPIMPPGGESPSISSPGAPRNRKVVWLRQHGIPAGRQRHCLPLLSVRCSLRLRRNAAGHTNKAARMPGPPPKGRTASRERPSPGRSLRFWGKWRREQSDAAAVQSTRPLTVVVDRAHSSEQSHVSRIALYH